MLIVSEFAAHANEQRDLPYLILVLILRIENVNNKTECKTESWFVITRIAPVLQQSDPVKQDQVPVKQPFHVY